MINHSGYTTEKIVLAGPRGPCAGVERAVIMLENALQTCGLPLFVLHEIVHNKHTLNYFINKGVTFVENIQDIPDGSTVMISAHGVAAEIEEAAAAKELLLINATCQLVQRVHLEAIRLEKEGYKIILIGHKNHPEVTGTCGRVKSPVNIVGRVADIKEISHADKMAYITQTTLSMDETAEIINKLKEKFPHIRGPELKTICYATQNRQRAVKLITEDIDMLIVIGSANSSNSNRLKEIGTQRNIPSYLIDGRKDFDVQWLKQYKTIGITAGASAPETLITELVDYIKSLRNNIIITEKIYTEENIKFRIPNIASIISQQKNPSR